MARRKYQQGYVYQKHTKRSDAWLPKEPAYSLRPVRPVHRARIELTFVETTSTITFRAQGEIWLKSLANRKRNPLEQTTIDTRCYAMDKWIYPVGGEFLKITPP